MLIVPLALLAAPPFGDAAEPAGPKKAQENQQNKDAKAAGTEKVSFHKQLLPILQANCYGCHQPAKSKGGYVMTDFAKLLKGGESGDAAVTPGAPDKSALVKAITPVKGDAEMPKDKKPLAADQIALIARWIAEGAVDDTPANARARYDADHPPVYTRPPVISALDFSPDSKLLAVAGFHEVLLLRADTLARVGRLVGLAERVQSVRFSPDGKRLAVTGGLPARTGEVQVWDVESRKLALSVPVTYDTVYGASWSPDGKKIAFGCGDNSVRAIDAKTGEQVLFQGAHNDWALETVFSTDGSHLISVSRDRTAKLTEVASQRFVDNITSITPGALKGGISAVARHPKRDEIVIGGADGVPKVYRVFRETARVIGDDSNLIRVMPAMTGRISSVAVSRDGRRIVAGSSLDGRGEVQVYSYEFDSKLTDKLKGILKKRVARRTAAERALVEKWTTSDVRSVSLAVIERGAVYAVAFRPDAKVIAAAGADGIVRLIDPERGSIVKEAAPAPLADKSALTAAAGPKATDDTPSDFIRDVNPVMSKVGCNQGTCHGAAQGKNGFKLSLRGYDPVEDVRALTDDLSSRRVNIASPDDSLMLLKATGAVPHVGGQLFKPGDKYYGIMRSWIAGGAVLDTATPRVARIEVSPKNPVIEGVGGQQPMHIVATYTDGKTRDVTAEAFVESGNSEVATADKRGHMTAVRRGEAAVLARYEGAYAATTLTVMGDRGGFAWQPPPTNNRIDELVAEKWKRLKILPSPLTTDAEFIRRVMLDLTGLPPTAAEVRAFLADQRPTRQKRDALIDRLIGGDAFVEHWTNKWADLLQVNRKFLGAEGSAAFRSWIRNEVVKNTAYDQFARKILTASGSNRENPAASYYKILREPGAITENTTHLFLAVRFNCNKCHDHPFERWTQNQYYETAAFFARVGLKSDPAAEGKTIAGTAVEGAKPLYEIVYEKDKGEVLHDRTRKPMAPKFPFAAKFTAGETATAREQLAAWVTSSDNPYFARSYVNRLWGYLLGRGIVEPIDDMRAGNPPTNPALLDYLTKELISSGFDTRHVLRLICTSRTYQLSVATNKWNADDKINYSHATARRLPAEVLYDAVHLVTGSVSKPPGLKPGTRAAAFPDAGVELPSGFLSTFGRPARESTCECERTSELRLGAVMSLVSGPTIADAIADPDNELGKLAAREKDDAKLISELFLRILSRNPTPQEVQATLASLREIDEDHRKLAAAQAARDKEVGPLRAKQEKERLAALQAAKVELAAYEKEAGPSLQAAERKHAELLAQRESDLRAYEESLPAKFTEWEKKQRLAGDWVPLVVTDFESTNGAKITAEADLSVYSSENGGGDYTITAETDLRGITGVRLEVIADKRLPGGGPGRGKDGKFTVTGFEVKAAPRSAPTKARRIALGNMRADFSEMEGIEAILQEKKVVDDNAKGKGNDKAKGKGKAEAATAKDKEKGKDKGKMKVKGWGIGSATGVTHWATFETREALGHAGGTVLTFVIRHDASVGEATVGRFRLSVTTTRRPIGLSLSDELRATLSREAEGGEESARSGALMKYFRAIDVELQRRMAAVAEAKKPLPPDAKLMALKARVDELSQPAPEDHKLAQLRQDVMASAKQIENKRLTVAQDLAWALINSPAFLFNR